MGREISARAIGTAKQSVFGRIVNCGFTLGEGHAGSDSSRQQHDQCDDGQRAEHRKKNLDPAVGTLAGQFAARERTQPDDDLAHRFLAAVGKARAVVAGAGGPGLEPILFR